MSNTLLSISGAGGSGQTTLQHGINERFPSSMFLSITTREPRPGEADNVDYRFVGVDTFDSFDDLLWQTTDPRSGIQYGARASDLSRALDATRLAVMCVFIDFQSEIEKIVREKYTRDIRFVHIHLLSPHTDEHLRRLTARGGDTQVIQRKLQAAKSIDACARELAKKMDLHLITPQSIADTRNEVLKVL